MDANTYYLNEYLNRMDRASTVADYLHDNYYVQVEDLVKRFKVADKELTESHFDQWYLDFEDEVNEVLGEMVSYVNDRGYDSNGWDLIDQLNSLTL
jgi:hypothetical protein